jgi:hypothetical protein
MPARSSRDSLSFKSASRTTATRRGTGACPAAIRWAWRGDIPQSLPAASRLRPSFWMAEVYCLWVIVVFLGWSLAGPSELMVADPWAAKPMGHFPAIRMTTKDSGFSPAKISPCAALIAKNSASGKSRSSKLRAYVTVMVMQWASSMLIWWPFPTCSVHAMEHDASARHSSDLFR